VTDITSYRFRPTPTSRHQPEVEVLQVAQAAVDELARAARGAGRVVGTLQQRDAVAARRGVERDAGAGDAAADDDDVELVLAERRESLAAHDHRAQSRRAWSAVRQGLRAPATGHTPLIGGWRLRHPDSNELQLVEL
jgi:hypothetical protein